MFHITTNPVDKAKHIYGIMNILLLCLPFLYFYCMSIHYCMTAHHACGTQMLLPTIRMSTLPADDTFIRVGVIVGMLLLLFVLSTAVVLIVVVVLMKGKAAHMQKRKMKIRGNLL